MAATNFVSFQTIDLDVFAQQPRINTIYTQLIFAFRFHHLVATSASEVIEILENALKTLHDAFPWTAGHVIQQRHKFTISLQNRTQVEVQDLRSNHEFPSYDDLLMTGFPYRWLDENVVSARNTIADASELESGLPVFVLKFNILNGGFMLSFDCQHGSMDMAGQVQLIRLFAKACRGDEYTVEELITGKMERSGIVPGLSETDMPNATDEDENPQEQRRTLDSQITSPLIWSYFRFTAQSLASIKAQAMEDVLNGLFVSTDDVLSAFIWQAITRTRARRLQGRHRIPSILSRNVDGRRCLDLPAAYPGLMVTSTTISKTNDELSECSLGEIALELRKHLEDSRLKHQLQVQAMRLLKGHVVMSSTSYPALDVRLSSWAKEDAYNIDFGPKLGLADAFRTPRFRNGARQGLVYFLPKERDGHIVVGICLMEDDMLDLRNDGLMIKHSMYIG